MESLIKKWRDYGDDTISWVSAMQKWELSSIPSTQVKSQAS